MSDEITNNLAAKIARLIQADETTNTSSLLQQQQILVDLHALQKSIGQISERLEKIEALQNSNNLPAYTSAIHSSKQHPSQEKFDIAEIIADEILESYEEKPCPYEPTGKPCDHCSMCNSRGF